MLRILFYSLSISLLRLSSGSDINSDRSALLSLRASLSGKEIQWNNTAPLCSWQGIVCNNSRVSEIHMPGRSLFGTLPTGVLGNLTALTFLSLRFNSISGSLPPDLTSLTQLRYLYLQGNRLSGEVPAVIFSLPGLIRVNLAGNNLSGQIPPAFNNLTQLATLLLENNKLTGQIPDLDLPHLKQFNVSNNQLDGTIPEKLGAVFPASSFQGNSVCGAPLLSCSNSNATSPSGSGVPESGGKKKLSGGAMAGIIVASVVVVVAFLLCLIFCCCRKKQDDERNRSREVYMAPTKESDVEMADAAATKKNDINGSDSVAAAPKSPPPPPAALASASGASKSLVFFGNARRVFELDDLLRASAEVLGKGMYGTTYKAALGSGMTVAVKRLKEVVVSEEAFRAKMEEIGSLDHENLNPLRAYHASGNESLLVFDYMPTGSLSALLHGNRAGGRTPLNWKTRSAIAVGAARGITYIHSNGPAISHGNIKSSNILLSSNFEARVCDFGLPQVVSPASAPNRVAGYRAPEVTDPRKVSQKADVYSFGVFLLELLTGKSPIVNEEGVDLPRWVRSVVREEWASQVFDVELLTHQHAEEEMVQLLQLAVDCTAQYPDNRPAMVDVTACIEQTVKPQD